jgi:hypothetical protein
MNDISKNRQHYARAAGPIITRSIQSTVVIVMTMIAMVMITMVVITMVVITMVVITMVVITMVVITMVVIVPTAIFVVAIPMALVEVVIAVVTLPVFWNPAIAWTALHKVTTAPYILALEKLPIAWRPDISFWHDRNHFDARWWRKADTDFNVDPCEGWSRNAASEQHCADQSGALQKRRELTRDFHFIFSKRVAKLVLNLICSNSNLRLC